jgi:hypothetical protein
MRAVVPRWVVRWCAPALLLLVVLVAQPAACPVGHHQLDAAPSVVASSVAASSLAVSSVAVSAASVSGVVPDFRHGPICHESSAGDLLGTRGHPARTSVVKTAAGSPSVVSSAAAARVSGSPTSSAPSATVPSGRAILLAIGIARS